MRSLAYMWSSSGDVKYHFGPYYLKWTYPTVAETLPVECVLLFFIHLKLEFLTQFPVSNDDFI